MEAYMDAVISMTLRVDVELWSRRMQLSVKSSWSISAKS